MLLSALLSAALSFAPVVHSKSSKWDTVAMGGYGNGAYSGADFPTNGFGVNNLDISSANPFNFTGAWFADIAHPTRPV